MYRVLFFDDNEVSELSARDIADALGFDRIAELPMNGEIIDIEEFNKDFCDVCKILNYINH